MDNLTKMAIAGDDNLSRSLKEALYETLTAILSPIQEVRTTAEEQIKALEVTEGMNVKFGVFNDVDKYPKVKVPAVDILRQNVK